MFRHSEIQRLLSERRQARQEAEEAQEQAERREEERARKRKFYDDVSQQKDDVQDLSYDDPPERDENSYGQSWVSEGSWLQVCGCGSTPQEYFDASTLAQWEQVSKLLSC